jgi:hypothetical protein
MSCPFHDRILNRDRCHHHVHHGCDLYHPCLTCYHWQRTPNADNMVGHYPCCTCEAFCTSWLWLMSFCFLLAHWPLWLWAPHDDGEPTFSI